MAIGATIYQKLLSSREEVKSMLKKAVEVGKKVTQVARETCEKFKFQTASGKLQVTSCTKALRRLEKEDPDVKLPEGTRKKSRPPIEPVYLDKPVPEPVDLPSDAQEIKNLSLITMTKGKEDLALWNTIMRDHPKGAPGSVIGEPIRLLVNSEFGYLGGFLFSLGFWNVGDRDRRIGWTNEEKTQNLKYLINMNRFLVRPGIKCAGLDKRMLDLAMQNIAGIFKSLYNYEPIIVESYVDNQYYTGNSLTNAGWICAGATKGRGRDRKKGQGPLSVKKIYLYFLVKDFRKAMSLSGNSKLEPLSIEESLKPDCLSREFADALPDKRLNKRLTEVANTMGKNPGAHLSSVHESDETKLKAAYRFISCKEGRIFTMPEILGTHFHRTIRRIANEDCVYLIQDGSWLNYNSLKHCDGLDDISKKAGGTTSSGLYLHTTIAVNKHNEMLGIVYASCIAMHYMTEEEKLVRGNLPQEAKQTQIWLDHLTYSATKVAALVPNVKIIVLSDRESDFYNYFTTYAELRQKYPNFHIIARLNYNRALFKSDDHLFDALDRLPATAYTTIYVPKLSSRSRDDPGRPSRIAKVEIRAGVFKLSQARTSIHKYPLTIFALNVREPNPPKGQESVNFYLAPSIPIETVQDQIFAAKTYGSRWVIEIFNNAMKSGCCEVENLRNRTADTLKNVIAINMVIAWRAMLRTFYPRRNPGKDPRIMFTEQELDCLKTVAESKKMKAPENLGECARLVGQMGGHLSSHYEHAGLKIMKEGFKKLSQLAEYSAAMKEKFSDVIFKRI